MNLFRNMARKAGFGMKSRDFTRTYFFDTGSAFWSDRNYEKFANEAYIKNVIAHRSISMIVQAASNVKLRLFSMDMGYKKEILKHPILDLFDNPNPADGSKEFLEKIYAHKIISGNAYVVALLDAKNQPFELYALRPDRVTVNPGKNMLPSSYTYKVDGNCYEYNVDALTGKSLILHLKNFHPTSDLYGLSPIEAAAYSIDQHNQAGEWNQALLKNGARPSGAIIVKDNVSDGGLNAEQYAELKSMVDDVFSGPRNAGRPILLSGGLDWKEMSLTPKDMDFIESKHSSARDIALALGVPPQLLGIPGDNTYSNLQEARLSLWEQTIIPMLDNVVRNLSVWISQYYTGKLSLEYDLDSISALSARRDVLWDRVNNSNFLTVNEKRAYVGLGPIENGDSLMK